MKLWEQNGVGGIRNIHSEVMSWGKGVGIAQKSWKLKKI